MLGGRRLALESTRDVTERGRWEQRWRLLLDELTHRGAQHAQVVQAIAHQSLRAPGSSQGFLERFGGRFAALAGVQTLLVNSESASAGMRARCNRISLLKTA
jgi:two-component system CheB/CheR fusion protein